jgi:hypothetical protein
MDQSFCDDWRVLSGRFKNEVALFTCSAAFEFLFVGATACFARPCNARENVGYMTLRNAIRLSPRFVDSHDVNKAK